MRAAMPDLLISSSHDLADPENYAFVESQVILKYRLPDREHLLANTVGKQ